MSPGASRRVALTQHRFVRRALPYLGNAAYVSLASGFLMTDVLSLRVLLVGGYSGLVVFHALHPSPLQIPMLWSAVFVGVNLMAVVALTKDRFPPQFSEDLTKIHEEYFPQMTRGEFAKLLAMSHEEVQPEGTELITEHVFSDKLYFIAEGEAEILVHRHDTSPLRFPIKRGGFVNDVAFQSGPRAKAYGTVRCLSRCRLLVWSQDQLRESLQREPSVMQHLNHVLVASLVWKLLQQRDHRNIEVEKPDSPLMRVLSRRSKGDRLPTRRTVTESEAERMVNDGVERAADLLRGQPRGD
jgi:CRP-like cAMP-binding protein